MMTSKRPASRTAPKDPAYTTELYDPSYYSKLTAAQSSLSHRWRCQWLQDALIPEPGDRIVDLGCGAGLVAHHLLMHGASVVGIDLAQSAIDQARQINARFESAEFFSGDASNCSFLDGESFDKACSVDVTEHCGPDIMLAIFTEAHRLLRPGGIYYVYTPNPQHWIERLKHWGILQQDPTHTGLRNRELVVRALQQSGFELVRELRPTSMIPYIKWLESMWQKLPVLGQLAIYRIALVARKPDGSRAPRENNTVTVEI